MQKWLLPPKVHKHIFKKDKDKALGLLSKITALNQSGFISDYDESYLRYVAAFRVRLLMEWGYYREALAWVCLENELYPENIQALVLKESIKKRINNLPEGIIDQEPIISDGWDGIAGMREVKALIENDIVLPFSNPELYKKFKISPPNGYLFYGPPGCGKTFIANRLAKKLGFNFISIKPSDIGSIYVHGTQLEIKKVFEDSKKQAPCLLFIDEFDSIAPSRASGNVSFSYKSEVNELLAQLDNISKSGVLFIAATNFIQNIDKAVMRPGRIDKKIFIGPPDFEARIESFKIHLHERPLGKINYEYISEMTQYFTHAEIEIICNETARVALSRESVITTDILGKIIYNFRPQLNKRIIDDY